MAHLVILLMLNPYKDNNSCTTDVIMATLNKHLHIMVIYIHIKFHQIPQIGYLVMAPDCCDRHISLSLQRGIINPAKLEWIVSASLG